MIGQIIFFIIATIGVTGTTMASRNHRWAGFVVSLMCALFWHFVLHFLLHWI